MRILEPITVLAATALVVTAAFRVGAQTPLPAGGTRDGLYTVEQAKQGEAAYLYLCVECHGESLEGGVAPPLAGSKFHERLKGKTLFFLFQRVRAPMPPYEPPQPNQEESFDILAYILSRNGFPAGPSRLHGDVDRLHEIPFEPAGR